MKAEIQFEDFLEIEKKLEIKVGLILTAERIPKSDKLLKLNVGFGKDDDRTVVTNIGNRIDFEDLPGTSHPFITNLAPAKMMGVESNAMIMLAESDEGELQIQGNMPGDQLL